MKDVLTQGGLLSGGCNFLSVQQQTRPIVKQVRHLVSGSFIYWLNV